MSNADATADLTAPGDSSKSPAKLDPYAEIVALARETPAGPQFMSKVLRCIAKHFNSPYAALHVRFAAEVVQDDCHTGPSDPKFWKSSVQSFLTDALGEGRAWAKLLKARSGTAKIAFISAPLTEHAGMGAGAIALVVDLHQESDLTHRLASLDALTRLASACVELVGERGTTSATQQAGGRAPTKALTTAGGYESSDEMAFAITNELRNKLGCELVALGLVRKRTVKIASISGLDDVSRRSPGVLVLVAAMEECLDADETLVFQHNGTWSDDDTPLRFHLHKQWHAAVKGDAVASIPLRHGGRTQAILSLRHRATQPFSREQLTNIQSRVEPYISALLLARRADRGLWTHARESSQEARAALLAPGHMGRKIVGTCVALACFGFVFGRMSYQPTVPCVVTAAHLRHVAAPIDGILIAAHVTDGDRVQRGDVLCEFDRRELDRQIAALDAELLVLERERDRAMAVDSPVEVQLAAAKQHQVRAQLDILQGRAEHTAVRAPIDGVVVKGDLRMMIGGVLQRGRPLFEIAPLEQWRLELQIPESLADDLGSDVPGVFASFARPEETHGFRLSRLQPAARSHNQKTVYMAEADIDADLAGILPGMEGVARIQLGSRPIWWVALHRAIDWIRMNLWL